MKKERNQKGFLDHEILTSGLGHLVGGVTTGLGVIGNPNPDFT
ncbi:MAG: hypothetical protein AAFQ98_15815 [Bacteroidota bacterium]